MNVRLLGLSARGVSALTPLGKSFSHQLELCIVEAANNIIRHAYHQINDGHIDLFIRIFKEYIEFEFRDTGIPMNTPPQPAFKPLDPQNVAFWPDKSMQMGVYLIQSIMDETRYRHDRGINHLHLIKRF